MTLLTKCIDCGRWIILPCRVEANLHQCMSCHDIEMLAHDNKFKLTEILALRKQVISLGGNLDENRRQRNENIGTVESRP